MRARGRSRGRRRRLAASDRAGPFGTPVKLTDSSPRRHPTVTSYVDQLPATVRSHIQAVLNDFLHAKASAADTDQLPREAARALQDFLDAGGKRLRPLLCVIGWHAAGGKGSPASVVQVASSLEMFHACCLIHDDIMDGSATRRGAPTVHRAFTAHYAHGRSKEAAERMGVSAAILVGDLALSWSDELLHTAGLAPDQLFRVLPLIDVMRTEVMYGQHLDVTATGDATASLERALAIVRFKSAKYTVERPLHIGAALAGAPARTQAALSAYALPVGEAFQLRDDLLGVFGDPAATGKSCLDDLREGKHTALIALALQHADDTDQRLLRNRLGARDLDEKGASLIRRVLIRTGARDRVERMIQARHARARQALAQGAFPPTASRALEELAHAVTARSA
ncbi:polyprenyl synthetase family protein [Streptomyces sp. NPDC047117]|uniref:polyprenyl synthetase family protein n=1 Tax=Streptomyces sp. NPDC047117 TaxID=3155379 RepID=UPI0033C4DBD6